MKKGCLITIILIFLIFTLASAGCAELPVENIPFLPESEDSPTDESMSEQNTTDLSYMTIATPYTTEAPEEKKELAGFEPPTQKPETEYKTLFQKEMRFQYNAIALDYDLKVPPMIFHIIACPDMMSTTKEGYSSYGSKEKYEYQKQIPNPIAKLTLTVYDQITKEVVIEQSYGPFNSGKETDIFKIFSAGEYHIEITGNSVDTDITISAPAENILQ
ncbi:MAG: hypothetical protein U9N40_03170 [Euryarchaeota archaeon]|nr:hypothetical protein [Euryarchaeota archaeon]